MSFLLPNADGYIFDFNGTLLWDGRENREAWDRTALRYCGRELSDAEFLSLNGRTDEETVAYFYPSAADAVKEEMIRFKEGFYKELCIKRGLGLSPGAEAILGKLRSEGARMAIASSAPWMNMEWYIPHFSLLSYFSEERIIAGREDIPSKPDPAIFTLAMGILGTEPERTVIFEDSGSGVAAALGAGAGLVIRIKAPDAPAIRSERVKEIASFEEIRFR